MYTSHNRAHRFAPLWLDMIILTESVVAA